MYPNSFEEYIYKNNIGYHASNSKELLEMVYISISKGLDNQTIEFVEGIFPKNLRGNSGKVTADLLINIAQND